MSEQRLNKIEYNSSPNKIYINSKREEFIIKKVETRMKITSNGNKRWDKFFLVSFIATGFEKWCGHSEITKGNIKDWLSPNVCGVGVVGNEIPLPQKHYLYDRWRNMLRRCYDENCSDYKTYGKVGCYVSDEWKYFPNFVRDIENKENVEKLKTTHKNSTDRYELDKDIIKDGNKIYCNEYVSIVSHRDNIAERNIRYGHNRDKTTKPVFRISSDLQEVKNYTSVSEAVIDNVGCHSNCISSICGGIGFKHRGYYWMYNNGETTEEVIRLINNRLKTQIEKDDNNGQ